MRIYIFHYVTNERLSNGLEFVRTETIEVEPESVTVTGEDERGQLGSASLPDGGELPVSRLYGEGYGRSWICMINDSTGKRWA